MCLDQISIMNRTKYKRGIFLPILLPVCLLGFFSSVFLILGPRDCPFAISVTPLTLVINQFVRSANPMFCSTRVTTAKHFINTPFSTVDLGKSPRKHRSIFQSPAALLSPSFALGWACWGRANPI